MRGWSIRSESWGTLLENLLRLEEAVEGRPEVQETSGL